MSKAETYSHSEDEIAIIGMAGRFPGARNLQEFWTCLREGREAVSPLSDEDILAAGVEPALVNHPNYVKSRALLEDIEYFDAAFFGYTPREVEVMDPQHRFFLECAWHALEDAGYNTPLGTERRIGVYAGGNLSTYLLFNLLPQRALLASLGELQIITSNDKDYLSTRVSYKLNLKGPSVTVQTACSSSLVAVHLACESLLNGECDLALAGGVSIHANQNTGYLYQEGGIVSPDGHCRAFDAQAQGTIFSSGVGAVVVKRLTDAVADRDHIYAIIKGSAINNDGAMKMGYTAPSVEGQAQVIIEAQAMAGVEAETITYIEAHGTGTPLGDPIEVTALTQAFHTTTQATGFCALGSVKTNLGHLDAAAGIAGLIKTVLMLKHQQLVPSLHYKHPNPKIDFAQSPFFVNTTLRAWSSPEGMPRRAGVSSFGIGGTNAHVIVEEAPIRTSSSSSRSWQLLCLSAKTASALDHLATQVATVLRSPASPPLCLADVAYTLQVGRQSFSHRRALVCRDAEEAAQLLIAPNPEKVDSEIQELDERPVVFLLPGQGTQYVHMAEELYTTEEVFRAEVERCCQLLRPHLGLDLREFLYPTSERQETARARLNQTAFTQPALFVTEYALAKLWMSWGVHPEALLGHSIGEYVAACLAGVFSLEEALELVAERGRLIQHLPAGAMLAVPLDEAAIQPLLGEQLSLAAVNGPALCVVAGPNQAIMELQQILQNREIPGHLLQTSHAFHSAMMEPVVEPLTRLVQRFTLHAPQIPYIANVTGTWITAEQTTDPHYWGQHARQAVRFAHGLETVLHNPERVLLEVGPGRTLSNLARRQAPRQREIVASLRSAQESSSDVALLLKNVGRLWLAGVQVDWNGFYAQEQRYRLSLSGYPFERRRYWIEPPKAGGAFVPYESQLADQDEQPKEALSAYSRPGTKYHTAANNGIEKVIISIWEEILGIELIKASDSFFEIGGNSLLATQVLSRLRATFQMELPIRLIFETPTVSGLARQITDLQLSNQNGHIPLQSVSRSGNLPLSFAQQRLWFLDQLEPGSPYHIPAALRLKGPLHVSFLIQSFKETLRRHETLRTSFVTVNGQPSQVINPDPSLTIPLIDLQQVKDAEQEAEVFRLATEEARIPFILSEGPLIRATLLQLGSEEHILLLTMHHIISDGWSMGILMRDIAAFYETLSNGTPLQLPPLPIQYSDFAHWQRQWLQGETLHTQLSYWKAQLSQAPRILELPIDHPRPQIQTFRGATQSLRLPQSLAEALRELSHREGVTLFMTLLACFQILLCRYTGQDYISVGTPIANRNRIETEELIGFFVNTLVMCTCMSGNPTFLELLERVREVALGAYMHQDIPFERIVEEIAPERDLSCTPLFQVMFALQNTPVPSIRTRGLTLKALELKSETAKFDLSLDMIEIEQELIASLEYNTDLFDASTITRILDHFRKLLEEIVAHPESRILELPMLDEEERQQILYAWNSNEKYYPNNICIHQIFERQVELTPHAVAVTIPSTGPGKSKKELTYFELNQRANKLAYQLKELGIGPDIKVGIYMERSMEMIIAIFGILKTGGAYIPLDATYSAERLAFYLQDAKVPVLLTQQKLMSQIPSYGAAVVCLDSEEWSTNESALSPVCRTGADNLAYVIYTSGSTGKPKGTMISHRSIVNAYYAWEEAYSLRQTSQCHLQMASFSFDVFSGDLFRALCSGARLVLCPQELLLEPDKLYELMSREKIDTAEFVPVVLRGLIQYLHKTRQTLDFMHVLAVGSDSWYMGEYREIQQLCGPKTRIINSYGLSEATIDSMYFENRTDDSTYDGLVPLGRPFANTQLYILDKLLQPLPIGVPGELHVSGAGLARGYLNRPELTAEKFVPHPFSPTPGMRLYKTGDLALYTKDGTIKLIGRLDHQIKVRGFRIEAGDIESLLGEHPAISECVVIAQEDSFKNKYLVAYIVPNPDQTPTSADLQDFLRKRLPMYMIPSSFIVLDLMPLTPNGKIDRRALPISDHSILGNTYVAPSNWIESSVIEIWKKLLHVEQIGVQDDFFELGGHSLLVPQLVSLLNETFHIEFPLRLLFGASTVSELADVIDKILRKLPQEKGALDLDLEREVVLDPAIGREALPLSNTDIPASIFLTGVTGFLGAYMLQSMLQQTTADIYCLVRAENTENASKRIQRNLEFYQLWNESLRHRIIPVPGDLSQPLLGLSPQEFQLMAKKIDAIYHCGAWVNFTYPYQALKSANVLSTQEILRMASQVTIKPVHFISTLNVFSPADYPEGEIIRENTSLDKSAGLIDGYAQSKWVAERLLSVALSRGIPVSIYRLGLLGGDSKKGITHTKDLIWAMIKSCIQLGSAPNAEMTLDIAPVDYISRAIIYLSQQKESEGRAFHLFNWHPFTWNELIAAICKLGYPIRQVSYDQWQSDLISLAQHAPNNPLGAFMPLFPKPASTEQVSGRVIPLRFDCQDTLKKLESASIICPQMSMDLLQQYLASMIQSGYLDAPSPRRR